MKKNSSEESTKLRIGSQFFLLCVVGGCAGSLQDRGDKALNAGKPAVALAYYDYSLQFESPTGAEAERLASARTRAQVGMLREGIRLAEQSRKAGNFAQALGRYNYVRHTGAEWSGDLGWPGERALGRPIDSVEAEIRQGVDAVRVLLLEADVAAEAGRQMDGREAASLAAWMGLQERSKQVPSDSLRSKVDKYFRQAAGHFLRGEQKRGEQMLAAGQPEKAFVHLIAVRLQASEWKAENLEPGLSAAVDRAAELMWSDLAPGLVPTGYARAIARAEAITSLLPPGHPISVRTQEAKARSARFHLQLAEAAPDKFATRLFHLQAAARYGAPADASLPGLEQQLKARSTVAFNVTGSGGSGACADLIGRLKDRLPANGPSPVQVLVQIASCTPNQREWTTEEKYTTTNSETVSTPYRTKRVCREQKIMVNGSCRAWNKAGDCKEWYQMPSTSTVCNDETTGGDTRTISVPEQRTRTLNHKESTLNAEGSMRLSWDGQTLTVPVSYSASEAGTTSVSGLLDGLVTNMARACEGQSAGIQPKRSQSLLSDGIAAEAAGNLKDAEESYLMSVRFGSTGPSVGTWFLGRYGLGLGEVSEILAGSRSSLSSSLKAATLEIPTPSTRTELEDEPDWDVKIALQTELPDKDVREIGLLREKLRKKRAQSQ